MGGQWPNLKPNTIFDKIRVGSRTPTLKLRRTDLLYNTLTPLYQNLPGQLEIDTPNGIEIGIGGSGTYPDGLSIGFNAEIHQNGLGRVPARLIVVFPPSDVVEGLVRSISKEMFDGN